MRSQRRRLLKAAALPLLVAALIGCDRRVEPWIPADQEPPQSDRPLHIPGFGAPQPSRPPPMARAGRPAETDAAAGIRGTLRLGDGQQPPSGGVLFVIARSGSGGGPPLAVKRLPAGPFPLAFEIGPGDVMIEGMPFSGPIRLTARVDSDGNPMTRDPSDLSAEAADPLEPGTDDVELVLRAD